MLLGYYERSVRTANYVRGSWHRSGTERSDGLHGGPALETSVDEGSADRVGAPLPAASRPAKRGEARVLRPGVRSAISRTIGLPTTWSCSTPTTWSQRDAPACSVYAPCTLPGPNGCGWQVSPRRLGWPVSIRRPNR